VCVHHESRATTVSAPRGAFNIDLEMETRQQLKISIAAACPKSGIDKDLKAGDLVKIPAQASRGNPDIA